MFAAADFVNRLTSPCKYEPDTRRPAFEIGKPGQVLLIALLLDVLKLKKSSETSHGDSTSTASLS